MATPTSLYRLSGRKRSLIGYSQLWLAPSHLLVVKSTRFAEQYHRFALADIQAIAVTQLPERAPLQLAAGAAAAAWTLGTLAVSSILAKGFFAITGLAGLALVIADVARGLRCRCHLYTAVSRELLAPVSRLRAARALLARIQPAIESEQGRLALEDGALPGEPPPAVTPASPPEVVSAPGYLPEFLFGLFLVDAALLAADARFPRAETSSALFTTFFAEVVLAVVVLLRGARDPRRALRVVVLAALLCIGWDAFGLVSGVSGWVMQRTEELRQGKQPPPVFSWSPSYRETFFAIAWRLAAGLTGGVAALIERRAGVRE